MIAEQPSADECCNWMIPFINQRETATVPYMATTMRASDNALNGCPAAASHFINFPVRELATATPATFATVDVVSALCVASVADVAVADC